MRWFPSKENFQGMSYGDWATTWDNWLMSDNPDQGNRKDIVFLRGNLDYRSVAPGQAFPRYIPPRSDLSLIGI